ncbi:MAG TPA: hypothetical protein VK539_27005 [Myxococcaceae bacterium]|nr:hypothetical protein [Myxococcaceae bacterium]
MSEQKGFGSKLLGIFVETDEDVRKEEQEDEVIPTGGGHKSAADLVAELASAGAAVPGGRRGAVPSPEVESASPLPSLRPDKLPAAVTPGAPLDFEAIFRELGMDPDELDRVRKAEELLKSLPDATPQPVKKQIVEASLKAFGFDLGKIAQAALNKRKALETYVRVNETTTAKAVQDAEAQVQALNEKIASLRADIQKRTQSLTQISVAVEERKKDVQKIIEFFQSSPPSGTP